MKDISLRILDMECAACVARLDRALEKLPGVQRAAVNYTAASALITYDEGVTDLAAIAARVKRAGFRVPVEEQDLLPAEADAAKTAAAADALRAVFGVKDVAVQADGALTAYLWPIGVDGRDLAAACADRTSPSSRRASCCRPATSRSCRSCLTSRARPSAPSART